MGLLPTQKSMPQTDPSKLSMLLYSRSKFGKSEFCAQMPGALFLATEPGLSHLETYPVPIPDWDTLLGACGELAKGDHQFKVIIIDTIDICYKLCAQYICAKYKVEHEADLPYGKGWSLVSNEFQRVMLKLAHLPYGLVMISHTQEKEVETRTGKIIKVVPTLPDKAAKFILGLVDIIAFGDFEAESNADGEKVFRRVIRTKPTVYYDAGDRSGRLPDTIDFDFRAFNEAYRQALGTKRGTLPTGTPSPDPKAADSKPNKA